MLVNIIYNKYYFNLQLSKNLTRSWMSSTIPAEGLIFIKNCHFQFALYMDAKRIKIVMACFLFRNRH